MKKEKRPMLVKRGDSTFDRVVAHHRNPEDFPLTAKEQEQLDRWNEVFVLLLNHWTPFEVVEKLKRQGISRSQAYLDIKNAKSLFGDVLKAEKEADRALWIQWVKEYLKRSKQNGDSKAEGKALELLAKYAGWSHEEDANFNPEKLENVEIRFDLPKKYLKILEGMGDKGVDDFNSLDVTDVEYEDINDNAGPEES